MASFISTIISPSLYKAEITGQNCNAGARMQKAPAVSQDDVTLLLQTWSEGDETALDKLTPLVYAHAIRITQELERLCGTQPKRDPEPGSSDYIAQERQGKIKTAYASNRNRTRLAVRTLRSPSRCVKVRSGGLPQARFEESSSPGRLPASF